MRKTVLFKVIIAVAAVGLILISFSARDVLIDMGALDYSENEIEREFTDNRESFTEAVSYIVGLGGEGDIEPLDESRYLKEKSFGENVPTEMRGVFSDVLTKYFSRIKYVDEPLRIAFYSVNEGVAIVYDKGEPLSDGLKKELGGSWYLYIREDDPQETTSE